MKSLLSNLLCASLLFFAVGCGKDKGGSGGSSSSNLLNPGLDITSQQLIKRATDWYNGTLEGAPRSVGSYNAEKAVYTYSTTQVCEDKTFWKIKYRECKYNGTPEIVRTPITVYINADGKAIKDKGNAELNAIFSGSLGTIVEAKPVGSGIQLKIVKNDGLGSVLYYGINPSKHSSLNPEFKQEVTATKRIDTYINL